MRALEYVSIQCPYCGEPVELEIDCSVISQEYIEDCSVCCRPINLTVDASDPAAVRVDARTDSE